MSPSRRFRLLARRGPASGTEARGASLVEFAIILPVLLLLIFGVIEFGRFVSARETVNQAARNAARYGSANQVTVNGVPQYLDCALIRATGTDTGGMVSVVASDITVQYDEGPGTGTNGACTLGGSGPAENSVNSGDRVVVTVSTDLNLITPLISLFFGGTVTLTSTDRRTIFK
jgi:Flp pilus assembly protein TadG